MNRRNFIETSLLGATAMISVPAASMPWKRTYKMGLQLYSIHEDMTRDAIATLKAVKLMGFEDFETFGFDSDKGTYYGFKATEFKNILDELQLTVSSGHYGFAPYLDQPADDLSRFVDRCIQGAKALEMRYITWPWLAPDQRTLENFRRLPEILNRIGEQVTAAGLGFAYHNHGFEFIDHNGETGFDILLRETDASLVKMQLDMYWVMHASKRTPKELIAEHPGRYVMWHIKDMDKVSRDYTELGKGSIDYNKILPDPKESGLEFYYLEQGGNYAHSPMKSAAESADYFKKQLQHQL